MGVISQPALDVVAAVAFLQTQAQRFHEGLRQADDDTVVAATLAAHEAAHQRWVELIAAAERDLGSGVAHRIAALYAFHGRVAGCLERGTEHRLGRGVVREVREVLARCLDDLTRQSVGLLERAVAIRRMRSTSEPVERAGSR